MTRTIAILAVPGVQLLDVSGPLDVFAEANVQAGETVYRPCVVSSEGRAVRSSSGVRLLADHVIGEAWDVAEWGVIDTLLVAGAPKAAETRLDPALGDWLRAAAAASRRHGSVCSGAFLLGAAGLLDGRRVTTHWVVAERLALAFPSVTVEADAIHVRDGALRTAAGVTAGLDLALALVEEDCGYRMALNIAKGLVLFLRRSGSQKQFSPLIDDPAEANSRLRDLPAWLLDHLADDLSVEAMARARGMSGRNFSRQFAAVFDAGPADYVRRLRIEAAARHLEDAVHGWKEIAARCGMDGEALRRAFVRHMGITPQAYMTRYKVRNAVA